MTIEFDGQNNKLGTTTANSVTIKTNDTDAITIDSSQNVGVGGVSTVGGGATNSQILFSIPNTNRALTITTVADGAEFDVGTTNTNLGKDLIFASGGTEVARFTSAGLAIGGTGSANTLDDYEEGTFTPRYSSTGGDPASVTYDRQNGYYYKIGGVVHVWWTLRTDAINTSGMSGDFYVAGMPFNAGGTANDAVIAGGDVIVDNFLNDTVLTKTGILDNTPNIAFFVEGSHSGTDATTVLKNAVNANSMYGHMTYFID